MKKIVLFLALFIATHSYAQTDMALVDLYPVDYVSTGTTKQFYTIGHNIGSAGVAFNDLTVHWQFNGGAVQSGVPQSNVTWISVTQRKELTNPSFAFQAPNTAGHYFLKVWITNTATDVNAMNDTITKVVEVIDNLPQKNVLLEVFKHQACGPCYPGDTFLKAQADILPYYNVVNCYTYSGDVCYSQDGDDLENGLGPYAHPTVVFDHFLFPWETATLGNGFYTLNGQKYLRGFERREEFTEPVEVYFKTLDIDKTNRILTMDIAAKFYDTLNKDLRLNVYVLEDSIFGSQSSAPNPAAYYHTRVLRKILGGIWGSQNSIPLTVYPGQEVTKNYTYTVPTNMDMKKIRLIAIVQEYNSSRYGRKIYNSKKEFLKDYWNTPLAVNDVSRNKNLKIYPNPTNNFLHVGLNKNQKVASISVFDLSGRILMKNNNVSKIDVSGLLAGSYFVSITTDNGSEYKQVFIKK